MKMFSSLSLCHQASEESIDIPPKYKSDRIYHFLVDAKLKCITARRLEGKRIIVLNCNILMKKCIFGEFQKHQNEKFFSLVLAMVTSKEK